MNRRTVGLPVGGAALLLTLLGGQILAAQFSADMTEKFRDDVKTSKIYVQGDRYCMETTAGNEPLVVIVDPKANKTIVVVGSDKEYRELATDDMMSIMNDPFQGYRYTAGMGEETTVGSETIDGRECDKYVVTMSDREVMSRWVAKDLGFPIKIVAHGPPDKTIELTNIVMGPVDDTKFKIPDGFTLWIDPETLPVEPPEWAVGIEAAPVLTPPFEHAMAAGDMVRIKPASGTFLAVKAVSKTDAEATAKIIPFKDGRPLKKESWYNNVAQKGTLCERRYESPIEVDDYVLYVYDGDITVTAKHPAMAEKTAAAGEELRVPTPTWDNLQAYMVNVSDGESVVFLNYFKEGAPVDPEELGPAKWRRITLKEPGEVDSRGLVPKGDEIVLTVEQGKVLIKLAQFDSFEF